MKEPRTPIMAAIDLLNGVSPYDDVEHAKEVVISSLKSIMSDISFLHARMPEQEYGIVHGSVRRELKRQNEAKTFKLGLEPETWVSREFRLRNEDEKYLVLEYLMSLKADTMAQGNTVITTAPKCAINRIRDNLNLSLCSRDGSWVFLPTEVLHRDTVTVAYGPETREVPLHGPMDFSKDAITAEAQTAECGGDVIDPPEFQGGGDAEFIDRIIHASNAIDRLKKKDDDLEKSMRLDLKDGGRPAPVTTFWFASEERAKEASAMCVGDPTQIGWVRDGRKLAISTYKTTVLAAIAAVYRFERRAEREWVSKELPEEPVVIKTEQELFSTFGQPLVPSQDEVKVEAVIAESDVPSYSPECERCGMTGCNCGSYALEAEQDKSVLIGHKGDKFLDGGYFMPAPEKLTPKAGEWFAPAGKPCERCGEPGCRCG